MPSPADLGNLDIWYKGDAGLYDATGGGSAVTTDGAAIARVEDQTANARHATQAAGGSRPVYDATNGLFVFQGYLGGNRFLTAPSYTFNRQDFSLFCVCELTTQRNGMNGASTSSPHQFLRCATDTLNCYYDGNTSPGVLRVFNSTVKLSATVPLCGSRTLVGFVGTAAGVKCWAGGSYTSTSAPTSGSSTMAALFGADSAVQPLQAGIKDFLFYGRALTDGEVTTTLLPYAYTRGVQRAYYRQLVAVGDSITHGYYATLNRGWVQRLTLPDYVRRHICAQSGIQAATLDTNFAAVDGARRISGERNAYAVWAGVNDILGAGKTGAQAYASVDSIRQKIQASGDIAVGITMTPGTAAAVANNRGAFNAAMLAGGAGWDAVADLTAVSSLENASDTTRYPDGLHPSDLAYSEAAPAIQAALQPFFVSSHWHQTQVRRRRRRAA